ncbi:hypothetical protein LT493_04855 [Streptomyces tricolor]|nr:hypothetical protein [Streptomyces tricolor]
MKIWALARWVYGIDLHHRWVDTAFGTAPHTERLVPGSRGGDGDARRRRRPLLRPRRRPPRRGPLRRRRRATTEQLGLADTDLTVTEFSLALPGAATCTPSPATTPTSPPRAASSCAATAPTSAPSSTPCAKPGHTPWTAPSPRPPPPGRAR